MKSTYERVRVIISNCFAIPPEMVTQHATLESLGIDSLGLAEILFSIEDEFSVMLPPKPAELRSVADVVDYVNVLVEWRAPYSLNAAQR